MPSDPDAQMRDARIPVVVVDPLPVVRAGLLLLIEGSDVLCVAGQAGTADEALEAIASGPPGSVALVGLGLDGPRDASWLIGSIRARFPSTIVVAVGARADAVTISRALFDGADGFVGKEAGAEEFLEAVRTAASGQMVLVGPPPDWLQTIAMRLERGGDDEPELTVRERQVLGTAAEGLTARQIADRLGVRERTVTTHLSRIYAKLGVRTRVAAVRAAADAGLLTVAGPGEL